MAEPPPGEPLHRESGELRLGGHRQWAGLWFGIASMGAASGVIMVVGGAWAGWFLVVVFGPSAAVLGLALRPQSNELIINHDGYTVRSTLRSSSVAWKDIERIGTLETSREERVAFRYSPDYAANIPDAAELAQALGGFHRTLPMNYGLPAAELARIMRNYAGHD